MNGCEGLIVLKKTFFNLKLVYEGIVENLIKFLNSHQRALTQVNKFSLEDSLHENFFCIILIEVYTTFF